MTTRTRRKRQWRSPKTRTTSRRKPATAKAKRGKRGGGVRAMWKGRVTFGSVDIPVKLYSAITDKSIHFRLLDAKNKEPVKQQMIAPDTGDVVPSEEVKTAYQTNAGELVLLDAAELEATEPRDSRDIEVTRFVDAEDVASSWYDRPYYLGPDEESSRAYFALSRALGDEKKIGIARWVMRKKEYVGALKVEGDYLALITLRHAGEVVPASALPAPAGRDVTQKEIEMAKQLVESMLTDEKAFDLSKYRDTYRDRVLELVHAKAAGKVVKFPKASKKAETHSLADVLEKSLSAAKRRKSA